MSSWPLGVNVPSSPYDHKRIMRQELPRRMTVLQYPIRIRWDNHRSRRYDDSFPDVLWRLIVSELLWGEARRWPRAVSIGGLRSPRWR